MQLLLTILLSFTLSGCFESTISKLDQSIADLDKTSKELLIDVEELRCISSYETTIYPFISKTIETYKVTKEQAIDYLIKECTAKAVAEVEKRIKEEQK